VDPAVHEEPRSAAHAAAKASIYILTHALKVDVVADLRRVARHVQPNLFGVALQVPGFQMLLIVEKEVVHLPELPLCARAFRGFGGKQGVGMNVFQREVPVHVPHLFLEPLQKQFHRGGGLLAVGALEVAILHHGDRRMIRADGVIHRADRHVKVEICTWAHEAQIIGDLNGGIGSSCWNPPMLELVIDQRRRDLGGFEVGRVLPFQQRRMVGPFIFFDHIGPTDFPPGIPKTFDVRPHPHIGLSTVTYLFDGEIMHRDSVGSEEAIHPGEVNWMTAGRGITHSERFERARAKGDRLHGLQSWVALPREFEEIEPEFIHYGREDLPSVDEPGVFMRVLAGEAFGVRSEVRTHSPLFYLHWQLAEGAQVRMPETYTERAAYVAAGTVTVGDQKFGAGQMLVFTPGTSVAISADVESIVMGLGGEPVGERFIDWNFVSSSKERIEQAKADWRAGRMKLPDLDNQEFIPLPGDPPPPAPPFS
jgi:redox-sensitive bicupin YhaK (pirin superfamily)